MADKNRLKTDKLKFCTKFKVFGDQFFINYLSTQLKNNIHVNMLCVVVILIFC